MYISSTANNKPLIYKRPRLAQSRRIPWQRGWCYVHARTCRGDHPHCPPAHWSPVPGRWTSRGWDAGWAVSIISWCFECGPGSSLPCSALLGAGRDGGSPAGDGPWWPLRGGTASPEPPLLAPACKYHPANINIYEMISACLIHN